MPNRLIAAGEGGTWMHKTFDGVMLIKDSAFAFDYCLHTVENLHRFFFV